MNLGNNWPSGFESHSKTNQGFGNVSGDRNIVRDARSYLQDSDLIDMMDAVADEVFPDWAKEMLSKTARVSNDHNREAPE